MPSHPASLLNGAKTTPSLGKPGSEPDLAIEDCLREEMSRLAAVNKEIFQNVKSEPLAKVNEPNLDEHNLDEADPQESAEMSELEMLRAENAELKARFEEADQYLSSLAKEEESWTERQKEYETLLEEKSEIIRTLHMKLQAFAESPPPPKSDASSKSEAPEDQAEVKSLEEQRRQLEEDEKTLMAQMRQMEMAMSKDRAELARQRNDIQRLHAELSREIEMASRDPSLREKLLNLQRRQQAIAPIGRNPPARQTEAEAPKATPPPDSPEKARKAGLLRRLFG